MRESSSTERANPVTRKKERFTFTDEERQAEPACPYFGSCGGCKYQDVEYPLQVEAKARWLSDLFARPVEVVPSPVVYGYRNRMNFVYAFGKLGLRQFGSHKWVVDIDRCALMSEGANGLLARVRELLQQHNIACYNYIRHAGYLRYVCLRSTRLGESMVILVTANDSAEIRTVIEQLQGEATSLVWEIHEGLADLSEGRIHQAAGARTIRERLGRFIFQMGPNSFFQNNPYLIEVLFEDLAGFVQGRTLELYCGVGCIGIYVAERADAVLGLEAVEEAIELARENRKLNGVRGVKFEVAEVRPWLRDLGRKPKVHFDTIIVDPPREGLTPRVVKYLRRLAAPRMVYVSCNPRILREEVELFEDYQLAFLKGYDLFPQTPHVEALAVLERKTG